MPATEFYASYKAPVEDDAALVRPSWRELRERLGAPCQRADVTLGGVSLETLAAEARRQIVDAALLHTRAYTDADITEGGPLVVSGHQPELFHPGVWFKNFALDTLAKVSGGVGLHLIIDTDDCRAPSILAPVGSVATPRREPIAYDQLTALVPHEERRLADRATFLAFPGRVADAVAPFVPRPLVHDLWELTTPALERTDRLPALLSEGRHRLERSWGGQTLELPFSGVADTEGFRRLAAELLVRADETADAYNAALADYRVAHRLKNAAQPIPDLHRADGWVESPLWVWSTAAPRRHALYVKPLGDEVLLSDRQGWSAPVPVDRDGVVSALADLREAGVKVRSRALVTTLYCRLVLADLFLHGIGGAKYDQVTDRFAELLLGARPPAHATLTATLRLPIEHDSPNEQDRRAAIRKLRDLEYHPERFAPECEAAATKRRWVATPKTPANAAERHAAITAANRAMAATLGDERRAAEEELDAVERGLRAAAVLDSREHSFCLFPAEDVRRRLTGLSTVS